MNYIYLLIISLIGALIGIKLTKKLKKLKTFAAFNIGALTMAVMILVNMML